MASLNELIRQAEAKPDDAALALIVTVARLDREEFPEALQWADRAAALQPENWKCHLRRGAALDGMNRLEDARSAYLRALASTPSMEAHRELAGICLRTGEAAAAATHFEAAIRLNPDIEENYHDLAGALLVERQPGEAIACSMRSLDGVGVPAHILEGVLVQLIARGRHKEALDVTEQLRAHAPESYLIDGGLAEMAQQCRDLQAATHHYAKAFQAEPGNFRAAVSYLMHLVLRSELDAARRLFSQLHAQRIRFMPPAKGEPPVWDGSSLDGRTIVLDHRNSMGYGDAINFVRFARWLAAQGARVVAFSRPRITPLLSTVPGLDCAILRHDECPPPDCAIEMHYLLMFTGDDLPTLGDYVPYMNSSFWKVPSPIAELSGQNGCKVGVIWQGNELGPFNPYTTRCVPVEALEPLWRVPGVTFFNLQAGPCGQDLFQTSWGKSTIGFGPGYLPFGDTAAAMSALDLVITVDTGPGHIAGALGVPVFLMLPFAAEWRWFADRTDSPWYPSMRLFRQDSPGDWNGVVMRVADALRDFTDRKPYDILCASATS